MFIASVVAFLLLALVFAAVYPRTEYAPGYTRAAFRQVRVGMTTNEVRKLLGEPLRESADSLVKADPILLIYSSDEEGGPFDLGWYGCGLLVSNGIVVEKSSEFIYHPLWHIWRNWPFRSDDIKR